MTTPPTPLSFNEWCHDVNIERQYQHFHDEYGDLAGLLSDYKEVHYAEYLEEHKRLYRTYEKDEFDEDVEF